MSVTAFKRGERIYLRTAYGMREACKRLPGARWDPSEKAWHVPATTAAAGAVDRAFGHFGLQVDDDVHLLLEGARAARDALRFKDARDLPEIPARVPGGGASWLHQRQAFHFAKELDAAMLAMDMGTGKSMTAIALLEEWDAKRALILCPLSVCGVWPKQFGKHAVSEWETITPPPKSTIAKRAAYVAHPLMFPGAEKQVVILNYESAWREAMSALLGKYDWDVVILDESHRIKAAGGKASMFASRLRDRSRRRLCLTGTPMPHSPIDIYAQYRFLDPGIFGTSKNRFQNRYAVMGGFNNHQVVEWQNQEELTERIGSIAFFVGKEVLDLPDAVHMERTFQLGPKSMLLYRQLEKDFIGEVEEGVVLASNALTRSLRLRMATSGHTKTEAGVVALLDDEREKLLADVLADLPAREPVVVFATFHQDLEAIKRVCERQGRRYGELSGRRRDGLTGDSTMSTDIDVLGAQIKSGGTGIDLTRSHYVVYYNVDWSLGDYEQSLSRTHRPGQEHAVTYIHLIAERTVDETVMAALGQKKSTIEAVVEAAKKGALA